MPTIGEKIWALRTERGLSAKALAAGAGLHEATILRIEKGEGRSPHPDSLRAILLALHASAPLSESDAFELADRSRLSRGALVYALSRAAPMAGSPPAYPPPPIEAWRTRCHSLVDRMLARAERPQDVETALVAMVAAFEAAMPEAVEAPLLTRRGRPQQAEPGVVERTDEHFSPRQAQGG